MKRWLAILLVLVAGPACEKKRAAMQPATSPLPTEPPRWLVVGGGATPDMTQMSIEADLLLAVEVLGPRGRVLFGGGPGLGPVQVLDEKRRGEPLETKLADLFSPRPRDTHYRPTRLRVDAAGTKRRFLDELRAATRRGEDPFLLYIGGHGDMGETASDNGVSLWEQSFLSVTDLAVALDEATTARPVRMVVTTCYAGGFADFIFTGADSARGAAKGERCGFFATVWDLQATGCDPSPDRRKHEGYGVFFLNALRGKDRYGKPLSPESIDLDGDGKISLLEAHTRVRLISPAADVPISTSERWLRHAASLRWAEPSTPPPPAREDQAVVRALADRLGLRGKANQAEFRLDAIEAEIDGIDEDLEAADEAEQEAYRIAAAELLGRWPVLDDPWHPDFDAMLDDNRDAIEAQMTGSPAFENHRAAVAQVRELDTRLWELRRKAAPFERLTRAMDNIALAARLHAAGGADWGTYQRILACERSTP